MRLTFSNSDGTMAEVKLSDQPITIGRSDEANVVINDEKVSRTHCSIRLQDGAYFLKDLKSSNGTLVNGKPVDEAKLQEGDRIRVGAMLFTFAADKQPGTKTIFRQTEQDMAEGKGYGTILRKIVQDIDQPQKKGAV
jgi:pSer/pThr/pTyr-binding forkhead associated (FHA) protein